MGDCSISKIIWFIAICVLCTFAQDTFVHGVVYADEDVSIVGRVVGCGDGIVDSGESCDITDFNGQSCTTLGFTGGVIGCDNSCVFDTSACTISSNGGGGSGGSSQTNSARSLVAVNGITLPFGNVSLLVDGVLSATATADQIGRFQFSARNLVRGTYNFSLFVEDQGLIRSSTYSFTAYVRSRSVVSYTDVILSPTLTSDYKEVVRGRDINYFGYTVPNSRVVLQITASNTVQKTMTATSSPLGSFSFLVPTNSLSDGTYRGTVRSTYFASTTATSTPVLVVVGKTTINRDTQQRCVLRGDLNKDCKVNLIDFSILIFWFRTELSPEAKLLERERLSGDEKMNIVDFSIMLHNWTG